MTEPSKRYKIRTEAVLPPQIIALFFASAGLQQIQTENGNAELSKSRPSSPTSLKLSNILTALHSATDISGAKRCREYPIFHYIMLLTLTLFAFSCRANYAESSRESNTSSDVSSLNSGNDSENTSFTFVALPSSAYLNKVKTLLTGFAPTAEEINAVSANPMAIDGLVDEWMKTPEYRAIMLDFFSSSVQQTQATSFDYFQNNIGTSPLYALKKNLRDSFGLTMQSFVNEGAPFTRVASTRSFMMTSAMMAYYTFLDKQLRKDNGAPYDQLILNNSGYHFTLQNSGNQIPLSSSLDPNNPNFMVFYFPSIKKLQDPNPKCIYADPFTINRDNAYHGLYNVNSQLLSLMQGGGFIYSVGSTRCYAQPTPLTLMRPEDFNDWRMVTIRQPVAQESIPLFFDMAAFRQKDTLVASTPRVGFFTTPSFLAQWYTNPSNQARVTMNQTLIAALGHEFDGTNTISIPKTAALDAEHASDPACFSCHQNLDPMRQFFRHDYTIYFSPQQDSTQKSILPTFAFDGVSSQGATIYDLGDALASHPRFATAWTQKLCTWANSAPCDESDPEFLRVVQTFSASNHNWNTLMKTMMTSPLVTYSSETATAKLTGQITSISRREQFCALLDSRLGLNDFCGLRSSLDGQTDSILTGALPSNLYVRGVVNTVLVTSPSLMYRSTLENQCLAASKLVVDLGANSLFDSRHPSEAIAKIVNDFMGFSDERAEVPSILLNKHYLDAVAIGASSTDALRSTFIAACVSPPVSALGF